MGTEHGRPSLHHVGHVVPSIEKALPQWQAVLCAVETSALVLDPLQKVRAIFLTLPDRTIVELVEPEGPDSPVTNFLRKNARGGMHHLCFEVDGLERHLQYMAEQRATLFQAPVPAVAFGGRRIAWMMSREGLLMEFLERFV